MNEKEREELFQWRLNLACCIAFLPIAESCISTYVEGKASQARAERALSHQLSTDWIVNHSLVFDDLSQLRYYIEDMIIENKFKSSVRGSWVVSPRASILLA